MSHGRFLCSPPFVTPASNSVLFPAHVTLQLMSNPDTFVEPRKRYSVEGRMFSIHFVADDSNRVYSCVTDKEYPARIAFTLLDEAQTKFLTKVGRYVLLQLPASPEHCRLEYPTSLCCAQPLEGVMWCEIPGFNKPPSCTRCRSRSIASSGQQSTMTTNRQPPDVAPFVSNLHHQAMQGRADHKEKKSWQSDTHPVSIEFRNSTQNVL